MNLRNTKIKYRILSTKQVEIRNVCDVQEILLDDKKITFTEKEKVCLTIPLTVNQMINTNVITVVSKEGHEKIRIRSKLIKRNYFGQRNQLFSKMILWATALLGRTSYYYLKVKMNGSTAYQSYVKSFKEDICLVDSVFIESMNKNDISSSMIKMAADLQNSYEIVVVSTPKSEEKISSKLMYYGVDAKLVTYDEDEYYKRLRNSRLVLSDSTIFRGYIKTENQKYINTWHGTPLKKMGYEMFGGLNVANNVQRNFLQADLVTMNSEFGKEIMQKAFHFDGIKNLGAPKMDFYFQNNRNQEIRSEIGISLDVKVVLFAPTWRGETFLSDDGAMELNMQVTEWIKKVTSEKVIIFYNPHQSIASKISSAKIRKIPDYMDINDFCNAVDILVTDYSSIMFDFAILNKPIVLYTPDLEEYKQQRGLYLELEKLPFQKTKNDDELIKMIEGPEVHVDYGQFNNTFNQQEVGNSTELLLKAIRDEHQTKEVNQRKKMIIYPGSLQGNGITTAFYGLFENLKRYDKIDTYIYLTGPAFENIDIEEFQDLPAHIKIIASPKGTLRTTKQWQVFMKLSQNIKLNKRDVRNLDNDINLEIKRLFGNLKFDYALNFSGYERYINYFFTAVADKSIIAVHSDMNSEFNLKRNHNKYINFLSYQKSKYIAPISEELATTLNDTYYKSDKYRVCMNLFPIDRVNRMKSDDLIISEELMEILKDDEVIKFINIGRFSPEKSQVRLIEAYKQVKNQYPNKKLHLILIGTKGVDYEKIVGMCEGESSISIFTSINPFPILKHCNLFILSSHYEGLPMTFFEAIAFNVPIISTDIPTPRKFLANGFGKSYDNSVEGLITGMSEYIDDPFEITGDFSDYNNVQFRKILELIDEV